jgi:pilus assembly protein FimV
VAQAWEALRAMPEAGHVALASPRFLLRRPYGAKSEPIYEFDFEEFTEHEGLSGMLWANPVALVVILLARSFRKTGPSLGLGQVMTLGDIPFHYVKDRYGDQVALPCTERNLTQTKTQNAIARGFMPVVSVKGRDEVRLASFQSLAGDIVLGPWSGVAPPKPKPEPERAAPVEREEVSEDSASDDVSESEDSSDADLDALLAGFDDSSSSDDDTSSEAEDDEEMDADLAALLASL